MKYRTRGRLLQGLSGVEVHHVLAIAGFVESRDAVHGGIRLFVARLVVVRETAFAGFVLLLRKVRRGHGRRVGHLRGFPFVARRQGGIIGVLNLLVERFAQLLFVQSRIGRRQLRRGHTVARGMAVEDGHSERKSDVL